MIMINLSVDEFGWNSISREDREGKKQHAEAHK